MQSKWIRADRSQPETEVAPAIPKHCRPSGTSETLPRSRGERIFLYLLLLYIFTFYLFSMNCCYSIKLRFQTATQNNKIHDRNLKLPCLRFDILKCF